MADHLIPGQPLQPLSRLTPGQISHLPPAIDSQGYSTNPSTIKSRRRKMGLSGAKKHEDAARTADYKAMIYARNVVQKKPEYLAASECAKTEMLEIAMRETMEKRIAKGQDTKSKMAAWNAGQRPSASTTGPHTRVPISDFLVSNGYVPPSTSHPAPGQSRTVTAGTNGLGSPSGLSDPNGPFTTLAVHRYLSSGSASGSAPIANMNDQESKDAQIFGGGKLKRHGTAPILSPSGSLVNDGSSQRSTNLLVPGHSPSVQSNTKTSGTSVLLPDMIPESSMIHSIEQDGNADYGGQITALRDEVAQLRSLYENVLSHNKLTRDRDIQKFRGELDADKKRATNLDHRVACLESIAHAFQNAPMTEIVGRMSDLESVVEQLSAKVGEGCDAEVARMREIFASLREALARVGNFL